MCDKLSNLDLVRLRNKDLSIYDIESDEFSEYGRKIEDIEVCEILNAAKEIKLAAVGSNYEVSVEAFERSAAADLIRKKCFGELPIEIGYCYGHNNMLNAWEWHASSEINIAVTDMILILAKRSDFKEGRIDTKNAKIFYLKEGDVVEIYAASLHFWPCEVTEGGFGCVVALPKGTNLLLEEEKEDLLLFKKNKWLISHVENAALIEKGVYAGIVGDNMRVN